MRSVRTRAYLPALPSKAALARDPAEYNLNRRHFLWCAAPLSAAAAAALPALAATKLPQLGVFKRPCFGYCGAWIEHMKAARFAVNGVPVADTSPTHK